MLPIVAIVGRPNVGKSRLFNRLAGGKRAIVADAPGITRDRHYSQCEWLGREFIGVDTGGLELDPSADLERAVTKQSLYAVEEADVIICIFDGSAEPSSQDREVAQLLRKSKKPVLYAVNKIDWGGEERVVEFYELGLDKVYPISAEHGIGVDDLLDAVMNLLPIPEETPIEKKYDAIISVAGRPNVGKSTLINRIAGEERVVAHEVAGTTRDAIDVDIKFEGKEYLFIDTAGVKGKWRVSGTLEKFTAMRSLRAIDRGDLVLVLIDGEEGLTKQDLHLAGFVREQGKGLVILVNKWDKVTKDWKEYSDQLEYALGDLGNAPILPVSALTGYGCLKVFAEMGKIVTALDKKITTSELNRIVQDALAGHHLPDHQGKQIRIYYATQIGTRPPTFALFSNFPAAVPYTYRRYLSNRIAEAIGCESVPVKIVCRRK